MGRAPEAEALMSRLLERQEHILGTDHPETKLSKVQFVLTVFSFLCRFTLFRA